MTGSTHALAISSGCFAALGWGLTGTFVKLMPQFTTLEVLSIRLAIAFLVTLPLLIIRHALREELRRLLAKPVILGLSSLMVFYYLFAVRAFQLAPVSDVVLIIGLSPLFGLATKIVLRKPLVVTEWVGALVASGGLVLFVLPRLQGHQSDISIYLTGLSFALLSATVTLAYAFLFKFFAATQARLNPLLVSFITFAIGSMIVTPLTFLSTPQHFHGLMEPKMGAIALGLGILSTAVPTLCYSYAAKHLSPILTTALNLMTPIFAAAIATLLLHEYLSPWSMIGAVMIGIGILTLSAPQQSTTP